MGLPGLRGIFKYNSALAVFLPLAGPFASFSPVLASSQPDATFSTTTNVPDHTAAAPLMYNHLTITAIFRANLASNNKCVIVWANVVTLGASANLNANGRAGTTPSTSVGGTGGFGASGGGGGASSDNSLIFDQWFLGGTGGSGGNGTAGVLTGSPGAGGVGNGLTYRGAFAWPSGGNGAGDEAQNQGQGTGGAGFGGGGGGGSVPQISDWGGGAGGGGAGLIAIVCNQLIATSGAVMNCTGGNGASDTDGSYVSGGGGGGSIYVAAGSYNGLITGHGVNGGVGGLPASGSGTASIFKINANNSTTSKLFTDTW